MKKLLYIIFAPILIIVFSFFYENYAFNKYIDQSISKEKMNIPINEHAPAIASSQVFINASIDTVWGILTDINNWTKWQTNVTKAIVHGDIRQGTKFEWKAGGLSFKSKIHTSNPMSMFGWTGTTLGASAVHNWFFESRDNGTEVRVEESLQGVFPRLFSNYFQKNLKSGVIKNLRELKSAAENK